MALDRDEILEELRRRADENHPGALLGWDLGLSTSMSEEVGLVLDVFHIPSEKSRSFHRQMFRHLRRAERLLDRHLTMITHSPEQTREHFSKAADRIARAFESSRANRPLVASEWRFDGLPTGTLMDLPPVSGAPHLRAA